MMLLFALLTPAGLVAQDNEQATQMGRPARVQRMTYEQMTEKMVSELRLDEKQTKKVTKLNKKYKTYQRARPIIFLSRRSRLFPDSLLLVPPSTDGA